jgi:hypothetical protein
VPVQDLINSRHERLAAGLLEAVDLGQEFSGGPASLPHTDRGIAADLAVVHDM